MIVDVGTGTGIWAMDFADAHPESQVLGIDLSPIQPRFVPPNGMNAQYSFHYSIPFQSNLLLPYIPLSHPHPLTHIPQCLINH